MDPINNDNTASSPGTSPIDHAIPTFIQKGLTKAFERVLGDLWAIPSAWLQSAAQSINDKKDGRSVFRSSLARIAAEQVKNNQDVVHATVDSYLPSPVRKVVNVAKVLMLTAEKINDDSALSGNEPDLGDQPESDDWLNNFNRYAEDASSERMQDVWARVLKGEIVRPGSFSKVTLRSLYELEQDVARIFHDIQIEVVGDGINLHGLWEIMPGYTFAARQLFDAGLISSLPGYYFLHHEFNDSGIAIWAGKKLGMELRGPPKTSFKTGALPLTLAGRQLHQLIDDGDEMKRFNLLHVHLRQFFSEIGVYYIAVGDLALAADGSQTIVNALQIGPHIPAKPRP